MDDLKKLSVERLRELARKHLGKGHSRLRTKAQLLEALKGVLREPLARLREATSKVRVVDFPPGRKGRVRADRAAPAAPAEAASGSSRPADPGTRRAEGGASRGRATSKVRGRRKEPSTAPAPANSAPAADPVDARPRTGAPARRASPTSNGAPRERSTPRAAAAPPEAPVPPRVRSTPHAVAPPPAVTPTPADRSTPRTPVPPPPPPPEAPVEEGFFDAPTTPRRARRAPGRPEPFEPGPFASPREVGTDAPLLLVRDPSTLFVFWDFRRELERGAALGLREPRLLLRLHRGPDLDRTLELPLTSRSTYVTGLTPGQEYTAEVLLLGRDGWTRPVGSRSVARCLPPGRVSAQLEVRTLRLPWSEPLSAAPLPSAPSAARLEPLDSPRRVPLPTSPGVRGPADRSGQGGPRSGKN
jgi:hypothetical protein